MLNTVFGLLASLWLKRKREQRRDAAERVCWKLLILMGIGELEQIPMNLRPVIADEMQTWADLALPE